MAIGGMEQMMVAMLSKMGIDPEMVKSVALNVQATTVEVREGLQRIEAKQAEMDAKLDLILSHVQPKPDGGYVLGTGEGDDAIVQGLEETVPLVVGETEDAGFKPWPKTTFTEDAENVVDDPVEVAEHNLTQQGIPT
jgi:hypothetical protein